MRTFTVITDHSTDRVTAYDFSIIADGVLVLYDMVGLGVKAYAAGEWKRITKEGT